MRKFFMYKKNLLGLMLLGVFLFLISTAVPAVAGWETEKDCTNADGDVIKLKKKDPCVGACWGVKQGDGWVRQNTSESVAKSKYDDLCDGADSTNVSESGSTVRR